jgi:lipopolysaccharide transport system permease protein
MSELIILEAGRLEPRYCVDRCRELFRILARRDRPARYKQAAIGALWGPLLTMVAFTVIFGRLTKLPSDGTAPYPLMVFAGMLPWSFFASGLSEASNSLKNNANLIAQSVAENTGFEVDFVIPHSPSGSSISSKNIKRLWRT